MSPLRPTALFVCMVFVCMLASAAHLHAQPAPNSEPVPQASASNPDDAQYDELVQKALAEYGRGNFPEAKVFFARAHELRPSARTLRGLGLAAYEMRDYVEASGALRQALDSQEKPLTAEMRSKVEQTLEEADGFVARYELMVEPGAVTLQVDSRAPVLRHNLLLLNPGSHVITAEAENYEFFSRTVVVQGGERGTLKLVLNPLPNPAPAAAGPELAPPPPKPAPPVERSGWNTQRSVALGLGIGGIVAAGIGTTFGLMAASENSKSEEDCMKNQCQPAGYEHRDTALSRATASTVSFVVSGVLIAAGVVVYLTAPAGEQAPALALAPAFAPDAAALSLTGRF
jgi:hypothetical protein